MSLSIDQIRKLSDTEYEEYQALDEEGKEQFEYFYGFTTHTATPIQVQNKEVIQYQKAAQTIQLKSVAQLLDFAPHAGQQPLFYTFDAKYDTYNNFVLLLGRRTGKSEVTSVIAVREMFLPHSSTVLLTPVFENAKIIFLNVLKKINQLGMPIKTINKGSFRIELENGARFSAASAANVESVLGSSNSLIICDETQSIPDVKRILNQMLVPTLLDYGVRDSGILWAHQIILGTPRGEENELTDYYYNELTMKNWKSFTAPSTSNPTLPTSYIEQMRLELGDLLYRQEILAEIIGSDENVFYAFNREQNTYDPDDLRVNEHSEIICGIDIGWGDSTANVMIYRQPDGSYYVHQAYSQNHTTTENHVKNYRKLESQLVGTVDVRYCDPAAAQTIFDYTETYNYDVMSAKNDVNPSLQYINQLFAPSGINSKPKLYINKELTELIRQVSRIRNKPNSGKSAKDPFIKDPNGTHWDLVAALRYALYSDQYNNAALNIIT